MRAIQSVTFSYLPKQDRLLTAVNPGNSDAWSCWLTRRIVQALLERLPTFIENTSPLGKQVPAAVRGEILSFEREAAMASTTQAMSQTTVDALKMSASAAELVERFTIAEQKNFFRVEIQGETGNGAIGFFERAELQRFLQMLQTEVAKANWFVGSADSSDAPPTEPIDSKPVRH